jgi:two-component system chemotaxis sensor kinase CheA
VDRAKYERLFLDGAHEQLDALQTGMAALSRGEDEAAVPGIRRAWHSLKGMSATMGFDDLAGLAHDAEEQFRAPLPPRFPPTLLGTLHEACQQVACFLAAVDRHHTPPDLAPIRRRLQGIAGEDTGPGQAAAAGEPPALDMNLATHLPSSVRVGLQDLDGLLAEVIDLKATLSGLVAAGQGASPHGGAAQPPRTDPQGETWLRRAARGVGRVHRRVARMRLVPVSVAAPALQRLVADCANRLDKRAILDLCGDGLRVDRATLEALLNPLFHLLRNAVGHGLETPDERRRLGKPATGRITVSVLSRGDRLRITVEDDGRGIDTDRLALLLGEAGPSKEELDRPGADLAPYLCRPGLSTAAYATQVSGRGIGLDAVRRDLTRAGGRLTICSRPGAGTRVEATLPQTVSITRCLLARAGMTTYGIPLACVQAVEIHDSPPGPEGRAVPLELALGGVPPPGHGERIAVIYLDVPADAPQAVLVDALLGRLDAIVRPLAGSLAEGLLAGAALCGDGTVVAVIDPARLRPAPSVGRAITTAGSGEESDPWPARGASRPSG